LRIDSDVPDAADRLRRVFGIGAVEHVEEFPVESLEQVASEVASRSVDRVTGRTFAVRPKRIGSHDWRSQDLAVAAGTLLVEAGGSVDLSNPDVTVRVRIVESIGYLATSSEKGAGGLPAGTQGIALAMFSGGIDSPVAAYLIARRGVALDYLHFSLGCGQADHAAAIAHALAERHGAGTDPELVVADFEPAVAQLSEQVRPRNRQMALKALMYRSAEQIAAERPDTRALVTGESLGQVSTQTLDNLASLDRLVSIPVLRPLVGMDKQEIRRRAEVIGTYEMSARTRELCDISGGAKVSVATPPRALAIMSDGLDDLVGNVMATVKTTRLADWMPGA
jgi:thiamine biosynthesis protein ThiI